MSSADLLQPNKPAEMLGEDPQGSEPVYAQINKPKKSGPTSTSPVANDNENVDAFAPLVPEKTFENVESLEKNDSGKGEMLGESSKPMLRPKPRPKPAKKPSGIVPVSLILPGTKEDDPSETDLTSSDKDSEILPKQLSGNLLARFSEPQETQNVSERAVDGRPVPAKRPVTVIGTRSKPRSTTNPETMERNSADQELTKDRSQSGPPLPQKPAVQKRPITIIAGME